MKIKQKDLLLADLREVTGEKNMYQIAMRLNISREYLSMLVNQRTPLTLKAISKFVILLDIKYTDFIKKYCEVE